MELPQQKRRMGRQIPKLPQYAPLAHRLRTVVRRARCNRHILRKRGNDIDRRASVLCGAGNHPLHARANARHRDCRTDIQLRNNRRRNRRQRIGTPLHTPQLRHRRGVQRRQARTDGQTSALRANDLRQDTGFVYCSNAQRSHRATQKGELHGADATQTVGQNKRRLRRNYLRGRMQIYGVGARVFFALLPPLHGDEFQSILDIYQGRQRRATTEKRRNIRHRRCRCVRI